MNLPRFTAVMLFNCIYLPILLVVSLVVFMAQLLIVAPIRILYDLIRHARGR